MRLDRVLKYTGLISAIVLAPVAAQAGATITLLHSFDPDDYYWNADGAFPVAGLTLVGGVLYGTTSQGGGLANGGSLFELDLKTQVYHSVHGFGGVGGHGIRHEYALPTYPLAGLVNVNGALWGTTNQGGDVKGGGSGAVFKINRSSFGMKYIYNFPPGLYDLVNGAYPMAALIYQAGSLYGTTAGFDNIFGISNGGSVFKIDPATGAETTLYLFSGGSDGNNPRSAVVYQDGALYGTTYEGGAAGFGTVFKVDASTGAETVLYSFLGGGDGAFPNGLIFANGVLYGTTAYGGAGACTSDWYSGCGTVFSVDPATGAETIVYSFQGGADGVLPLASPIFVKDSLYGTTSSGGGSGCPNGAGCGIVFKVNPRSGTESVVYSFGDGASGANPAAPLIYSNGTFYGTAEKGGGGWGDGSIFSLKLK